MPAPRLDSHPVHLGRGGRAVPQPAFTGLEWYGDYVARHAADGAEGRLVTIHHFTESWDSWEMHPAGDELVCCLSGGMTLHQQHADGTTATVLLQPGEYAVNPPGTWHTADLDGPASALFVTAGMGTQHRAR
ncbi:cupin domain-containing protein [Novosphingobium sp. KCTC 2891]|uniref:cupin domain-containing protein n=1 Tax=Novosphingobium sp. KCTC 2891 TaxID=2989730 RepID=UPI00222321C3|nr:cupin domain-containing protein [Novosphingobium sp. KCTC 2891]MCW1382073.1 cupin domain-containing protein [Novosphingobium sp. KCTC 2891]